ncbi:MAG: hypothetical protein ABIK93_07490 [candidate division WOR-3 bacterium]
MSNSQKSKASNLDISSLTPARTTESLLRYDPYQIFRKGSTPYAIYARRKWLGEETESSRMAADQIVANLIQTQSPNGSWNDSVVETIQNLHLISLLAPKFNGRTKKAVDWLLEKHLEPMRHTAKDGVKYDGLFFQVNRKDANEINRRENFLFTRGCAGFVKTAAALLFAGIFTKQKDERVLQAFKTLDNILKRRQGKWCNNLPCSNNVLRAYVCHPLKRQSKETQTALKTLAKLQTRNGTWRGIKYFYHTFNIVAQSKLKIARQQVAKALPRIIQLQNRDGTFGKDNKEFYTFLVLDGLKKQRLKI